MALYKKEDSKKCIFKSEKQLFVSGRGSFEEFETQSENATITAVKWYDNRSVCLASTYATLFPIEKCKRFNKKTKNYDDIDIFNIVHLYNKHMGGVDLHDQMMAYYRMAFRSRKYYLRLVFHMIDMCVINNWLLYRRSLDKINFKRHQQNSLSEFKLRPSTSLILSGKNLIKKQGGPFFFSVDQEYFQKKHCGHATKPLPEQDVRTDGIGHLPEVADKRSTCKFPGCKGKILIFCTKCKVHLCCVIVLLDFILNKLFL